VVDLESAILNESETIPMFHLVTSMTRLWLTVSLLCVVGLIVAAPVPKKKPKDYGPVTDDQKKEASERLKKILLGMHNYHDANGHLPTDTCDGDGKLLLSWRVAVLPYIDDEDTELYKSFKLDEPWDSKNNLPLVEKLPKIYAPIRIEADEPGHTFIQGFHGKDVLFQLGKKVRIADITDGTSNSIAVVEAGESTVWTKPGGLPFDEKKDLPKFGAELDGDFHVGFLDGTVRLVRAKKADLKELKKLLTIGGGEVTDTDAILGKE
jgi:hypothetical protein